MSYSQETQNKQWWQRTWTKIIAAKVLFLSILVHFLFITGATVWIVQTIYNQPKKEFKGGEEGANKRTRAVEHKVSMTKKKKSMTSPLQAKRVTTTSLSKMALPELPMMPNVATNTPVAMAGTGGMGVGGISGGMGNGGGAGGGGLTAFGMRDNRGNGLVGQFYDLKRNKNRQTNGMTPDQYSQELAKFVKSGWSESILEKYLKGFRKLYSTYIFFPRIDSHEGPKAFGSDYAEPPGLWVALYKGQVSPPETGTYHFVAAGDDVMYVKFNGRLVLDQCLYGNKSGVIPLDSYKYPGFNYVNNGFAKSLPINVTAGEFYDIEVLIGDQIPLDMWAFLYIEKNGVTYKKDAGGAPILPVFRLSGDKPRNAPPSGDKLSPPYMEDGPIWKGRSMAAPSPTP